MISEQEYILTDRDFGEIRALIRDRTGISLSEAKRELVYGRLIRRLRHLRLKSFSAYLRLLQQDDSTEFEEFTNALTTNLTSFFREPHHFDYLADHVFPCLAARNAPARRIRIWSAACSTGEEAYSLAMALAESMDRFRGWDVRILATDLDSQVLAHAQAGVYRDERVQNIPEDRRTRWLREQGPHHYAISSEIRSLISFKQLNLMEQWPFSGPFDVVFCRNVVIYFDKETQRSLFARIAQIQIEGSHLFIGHSESLFKVSDQYALLGKTIYRRLGPASGR